MTKQARIEELEAALRIVATGIKRDKKLNACWLTGTGLAVHAVEQALKIGSYTPKSKK